MTIVRICRAVLRAVCTGTVAAALAGVASAAVTRALMTAVALLIHEPTHFSVGGSAGIALIYTVALLPGCIALSFSPRWWPWTSSAPGGLSRLLGGLHRGAGTPAAASDMTTARLAGLGIVLLAMAGAYAGDLRRR